MNKKKYIYICVEVGKREFESRFLLKKELEKRGFKVIIGLKDILIDLLVLNCLPPGIIFDKCAQMAINWRIELLKKRGFKYTCLDEEGIFSNIPEVASRNPDHKNCDYIFVNNNVHLKFLKKSQPKNFSINKLVVSGNPRQSELLHDDIHSQDIDKSTVLIIGNFVHLRHGGIDRVNHRDPSLIFTYDKDTHELTQNLINNKNLKIAYRPHPSETNWYKKYKDLTILDDKNIYYWLNRFDIVICFRCTTSLEARKIGKKVYTFSNNSSVAPFLNGVGVRFKNADELIALLKSKKYNVHAPKREKFILNSFIPHKFPEKIIANSLEEINIKKYACTNHSNFYLKILSKLLWLYYLRFNRKAILQKFFTIEILEKVKNNKLNEIAKFIYN